MAVVVVVMAEVEDIQEEDEPSVLKHLYGISADRNKQLKVKKKCTREGQRKS
jgi:hypothetical protein